MKRKVNVLSWLLYGALAALLYFFVKKQVQAKKDMKENDSDDDKTDEEKKPELKYPAKEKGFFDFTPWQWFGYDLRNLF